MNNIYNIYCDESYIDNPRANFMIIGALFVRRDEVPNIKNKIKELQNRYYIRGELKWVKTSKKSLKFYEELFKYLFSLEASVLCYKCIVVDKREINYKKYHNDDKELAFYKFYYELLRNKLEADKNYYIFLDFRPSKSKQRIKEFLTIVCGNVIKHIQSYPSDNNIFIQITDVITGAIGFSKNKLGTSENKKKLISILVKFLGKKDLEFCSPLNEEKFNIFCIILGGNK
ncbi:MAG: DUF3800 domain-containing protein [Candidatus Parcubacteria bacterium]|nr:DUF3800 domain-containing protein [Candidatus Parcubacteria bacterium]